MAKDRFAPKNLDEVLQAMPAKFANYVAKSSALSELHHSVADFLGEHLAKQVVVANYKDSTLVLQTASAAIAMRVNYMKTGLLSHLRKHGLAELAQIKVQTNPTQQPAQVHSSQQQKAAATKQNKPVISQQTADALKEIAANAPPSLQAKLLKLATHTK